MTRHEGSMVRRRVLARQLRLTFERLLSDALDPAESLVLIRRLAGR